MTLLVNLVVATGTRHSEEVWQTVNKVLYKPFAILYNIHLLNNNERVLLCQQLLIPL
jgi:hypothetical protein